MIKQRNLLTKQINELSKLSQYMLLWNVSAIQNFITEKSKGNIDEVKKTIEARNKLTREINELSTIILPFNAYAICVYIVYSREKDVWKRTQ